MISEQKDLRKDLEADQNQNHVADNPVSCSDTTNYPHLKYKLIDPYNSNKLTLEDLNTWVPIQQSTEVLQYEDLGINSHKNIHKLVLKLG